MRFEKQTFTDQTVTLDYNEFIDCTFDSCLLQYGGGAIAIGGAISLRNVRFGVVDAAHRTMTFIKFVLAMPNGEQLFRELLTNTPDEPARLNS